MLSRKQKNEEMHKTMAKFEDVMDPYHAQCKNCVDGKVIEDESAGEMVCTGCGCVLREGLVSEEQEWRTFENDSGNKADPNRVGGIENEQTEALGLSTTIDSASSFARAHNRAAMSGAQRALQRAWRKIDEVRQKLSLSNSVSKTAQFTYEGLLQCKTFKGRKTDAIAAACIFISCRAHNVPRTLKEIAIITDVNRRDITRMINRIKRTGVIPKVAAAQTSQLLGRFTSYLNLTGPVSRIAEHIVQEAEKCLPVEGRNPQTVAGAAIFMACNLSPSTQRSFDAIARVCQMEESTISSFYRTMFYPNRKKLLPPDTPQSSIDNLPSG